MKHRRLYGIYVLCILFISCSKQTSNLELKNEILFNNLTENAVVTTDNVWTIDKTGLIVGSGGQGYLSTTQVYTDFVLEAEFYPDQVINSGIFVRCKDNLGSALDCYEVNISDNHANPDFRTGSIVTHGPPLIQENSVGKWNKYKIKAEDNHIEVWLNGRKTADLFDTKRNGGYIVLQVFDKGTIKFRNVKVQSL